MAEWKEKTLECIVKDADGYSTLVDATFKYRFGDEMEVKLVSAKDRNGKKVDVFEGEKDRLEQECLWWSYKFEFGSKRNETDRNVKIARELVKIAKRLVAMECWNDSERTSKMFESVCSYLFEKGFNAIKSKSDEALYAKNVQVSGNNLTGAFNCLDLVMQDEIIDSFWKYLGGHININGKNYDADYVSRDQIVQIMFDSYDAWLEGVFSGANGITFFVDVYVDNAGHIIIETYCMLGVGVPEFNEERRIQKLDMAPLNTFRDEQDVAGWLDNNLNKFDGEFHLFNSLS